MLDNKKQVVHTTNMSRHIHSDYDVENSLGIIVRQAGRFMVNRLNSNFQTLDRSITSEQWGVLAHLHNRDGQTQQELAQKTCTDKTSVTRLINGMEKRKLVVRRPDKSDQRQKNIFLTPEGKKLFKKLIAPAKKTLSESQSGITDQDIEFCKKIIRKVIANLTV